MENTRRLKVFRQAVDVTRRLFLLKWCGLVCANGMCCLRQQWQTVFWSPELFCLSCDADLSIETSNSNAKCKNVGIGAFTLISIRWRVNGENLLAVCGGVHFLRRQFGGFRWRFLNRWSETKNKTNVLIEMAAARQLFVIRVQCSRRIWKKSNKFFSCSHRR